MDEKTLKLTSSHLNIVLCVICLNHILIKTKVIKLRCNHLYHSSCFKSYLKFFRGRNQLKTACYIC